MILPFSTIMGGKFTHFASKIWKGIIDYKLTDSTAHSELLQRMEKHKIVDLQTVKHPKIHTIRKDVYKRWRRGMDIHFYINNRRPDMCQFAPVIKVKHVQRIFMTYFHELEISIDGRQISKHEINYLFVNDGFDNYDDFEKYFLSQMDDEKEFSGRIIHWTDLEY